MAKRKEGVMPSPAPKGEKPSGIRVNWKAKAERLQTECVALGQSTAALTDRYNTIRAKMDIHEGEIARLEKVISERANTIERLTVGIDQYQKDIATHIATADDRSAYIDELKAKITELEGLSQVAAQLYERGINSKEAQNAAERIRWQADGEHYRATLEAYRRDVERIPRWLRGLFLSSPKHEG